jgi:lysylphosphatidylglycerol synthetase-like protein (DUF2156 family)
MPDVCIADCLQRWGNSSSIALFDPCCKVFSIPTINGAIGYRVEAGCCIVFGDPICSPQDLPHLIEHFHNFCNQQSKNIVYITASEHFAQWTLKNNFCRCAASIGSEVVLNPMIDLKAKRGTAGRILRNLFNYSTRLGMTVHEYKDKDSTIERDFEKVKERWLRHRRGPQIHLGILDIFAYRSNKRYFYACHNGVIIGVLIISRLDMCKGWVMNILMRIPEAPKTTSEFLILSILDILRQEGCSYFSIGTIPALQLEKTEGLSSISELLARTAFKLAVKIFNLSNRQKYWKKFNPETKPTFLLVSRPKIGIREVIGIMRAFNAPI